MRTVTRRLSLVAVLAVAACSDPVAPTAPPRATRGIEPVADAGDPSVLAAIPGYAGFYLDAGGRPTVRLREPSRRGDVERALGTSDVQIVASTYDMATLDHWYDISRRRVEGIEGADFADLDEATNLLHFGVATPDAQTQVVRLLESLGIPDDAFLVEVMPEEEQIVTLRERVRPTLGGIQIDNADSRGACTLGFNATLGGELSFVTNSHCTKTMGRVDGDRFYQPTIADGNRVGTEVSDPPFFVGGQCADGRRCRFSDAARIKYLATLTLANFSVSLGRIARPNGVNDGSIDINFLDPYFTIAAAATAETTFVVGTVLNKVGRTTGWTRGPVLRTCVDRKGGGTWMLCQTQVKANSGPGDSGSPVFDVTDAITGRVRLVGILWGGGAEDDGARRFTFSPYAFVRRELGNLTVF